MDANRHGFHIGIERINAHYLLSVSVCGTLTHQDYQRIAPMIASALAPVDEQLVDVLIDVTELQGWELRAAWDDFSLGLQHGNKFNRVAIIGSHRWHQYAAKVANWFVSGEVRYFKSTAAALGWLLSPLL